MTMYSICLNYSCIFFFTFGGLYRVYSYPFFFFDFSQIIITYFTLFIILYIYQVLFGCIFYVWGCCVYFYFYCVLWCCLVGNLIGEWCYQYYCLIYCSIYFSIKRRETMFCLSCFVLNVFLSIHLFQTLQISLPTLLLCIPM